MGILVTILALGIVIFFHELGHFLMAKRAGIGVYEFSIGMGPKVVGWKRDETEYTLRVLPIGGFVKLAGMDEPEGGQSVDAVPDEINYHKKSFSARFLTLVSGCVMNFILGILIFFCMIKFIGEPIIEQRLKAVLPESPAAAAGLLPGDRVVELDGDIITDISFQFLPKIKENPGRPLTITYERDGKQYDQTIVPAIKTDDADQTEIGHIGVMFESVYTPLPWGESLVRSCVAFWFQVENALMSLKMLLTGGVTIKEMAGPVGIVQFASFNLGQSWYQFIHFMAVISILLGVFNLFPIPLLDGGHIFFLAIEYMRGTPLPKKIERHIYNISGALLISLMVIFLFNDILNWTERKTVLDAFARK